MRYHWAHREQELKRMREWKLKNPEKVKAHNGARDKEEMRRDSKSAYDANPKKFREKSRKWRTKNKEKAIAAHKRWTLENPEKYKSSMARYQKANRLRYNLHEAKRRAMISSGEVVDPKEVIARCGMICGICLKKIKTKKEISWDHIVPLSKGGLHETSNIQPSHLICNIMKGAK